MEFTDSLYLKQSHPTVVRAVWEYININPVVTKRQIVEALLPMGSTEGTIGTTLHSLHAKGMVVRDPLTKTYRTSSNVYVRRTNRMVRRDITNMVECWEESYQREVFSALWSALIAKGENCVRNY